MRKQTLKNRNQRGMEWISRINLAIHRAWMLDENFSYQELDAHEDAQGILMQCSMLLHQEADRLSWITQRELDREESACAPQS